MSWGTVAAVGGLAASLYGQTQLGRYSGAAHSALAPVAYHSSNYLNKAFWTDKKKEKGFGPRRKWMRQQALEDGSSAERALAAAEARMKLAEKNLQTAKKVQWGRHPGAALGARGLDEKAARAEYAAAAKDLSATRNRTAAARGSAREAFAAQRHYTQRRFARDARRRGRLRRYAMRSAGARFASHYRYRRQRYF